MASTIAGPSGASASDGLQAIGTPAVKQGVVLDFGELRAGLDQRDVDRGAEIGDDARRAQGVAHQRAAAGAEFDQPHRVRAPHRQPGLRRPEAEQFAEHLRDFRRRGEIARGAEGIAVHVIAVFVIGEREFHVALDAYRAGRPAIIALISSPSALMLSPRRRARSTG